METNIKKTCFICKQSFTDGGTHIYQETAKYSKSTFINILNNIKQTEFEDNPEFDSGCRSCISKLNKYDRAMVTANDISKEIIQLIEKSNKLLRLQLSILHSDDIDVKLDSTNDQIQEDKCDTNHKNNTTQSLHGEQNPDKKNLKEEKFEITNPNSYTTQWLNNETFEEKLNLDKGITNRKSSTTPWVQIAQIDEKLDLINISDKIQEDKIENLDLINISDKIHEDKIDITNYKNNTTTFHNSEKIKQTTLNNSTSKNCNEVLKNVNIKLRIKNMKYECSECGIKFSKKYTLHCHLQNHNKNNNYSTNQVDNLSTFKCEHCDFIAKSQPILNGHKKNKHGNLKPFKCNLCEKKFAQSSSLNRHLPAHTGEKRFQCEKCGKKFGEYSSFRMHKLAHDNVREKECTICGLKFFSTSHLKRHSMVHSGEKPHKCPNCGKSFSQRYNMNLHLRKYCDIKKIKKELGCIICLNTFKNNKELKNHNCEPIQQSSTMI